MPRNNSPFEVGFDGLRELIHHNHRLMTGVSKNKTKLKQAVNNYRFEVADNFDTEGGSTPFGQWQPLSAARIAERNGREHPILVDTGDLRRVAVNVTGSGDGVKAETKYGDKDVTLTISGEKVRNQFFFMNEYGWMTPPRVFWPFYSEQHDRIFAPFQAWAESWENEV